jgi:DNA-binding transcriptional MocR family regulator
MKEYRDGVAMIPITGLVDDRLPSRIVQQFLLAALNGEYKAADRLPSERELAQTLRVSRNTVTAAYAELEQTGIIRRIHGKGAFLCALPGNMTSLCWSGKISRFADSLDEPVLELLARRCADQMPFSLSAGTPSFEIISKDMYKNSVTSVIDATFPQVLAVASTEGQWKLREAIGSWIGCQPQNSLITAGAQEGIDLIARCLIERGDYVVVDSPTYPGALQSFLSAGARMLPWKTTWSLSHLEELLVRYRPKFIFTMPTLHNPTGKTMDLHTRIGLLEMAVRYSVPDVEDDVYTKTYSGTSSLPEALYQLDTHAQVISLSTFSKIFAPGLRIGWLTAPPYMIKQLSLIKMRSSLFTSGVNQLVLAHLITSGQLDDHLVALRRHHLMLCETAVTALEPSLRRGLLQCSMPSGSLYLWCKLLHPLDPEAFLEALEAQGLYVAPGFAFEPVRTVRHSRYFRLCFTALAKETLIEAIDVLNSTLNNAILATSSA